MPVRRARTTQTRKRRRPAKAAKPSPNREVKSPPSDLPPIVAPERVILRTDGGFEVEIESDSQLAAIALHWSYRVRNRARWRDDDFTLETLEDFAQRDLKGLGVSPSALERFVEEGFVEVSIPWWEPKQDNSRAHLFPWESVLNLATRTLRDARLLLVVRHLRRASTGTERPESSGSPLVVISSPGKIGTEYDFADERALILASLERKDPAPVASPTLEMLTSEVKKVMPGIIHLSGVDTHQGAVILDDEDSEVIGDGVYLASEDGEPEAVSAEALAKALNSGATSPSLVTLNLYNSSARLCPWIVALGAGAAIGLQDEVDDVVAERFFGDFYSAWRISRFARRRAFEIALGQAAADSSSVRLGGIVLWTAHSLVAEEPVGPKRAPKPRPDQDDLTKSVRSERESLIQIQDAADLKGTLGVIPKPRDELNYALLHNDVDLFESFLFRKFRPGTLNDVKVEVQLSVGSSPFTYKQTLALVDPVTDILRSVRVPLTWDYLRSMRETTRTALYVSVKCGNLQAFEQTFPVLLHPLEQWRDDPLENRYLASFVQPGDPAVAQIIERARPYLRALLDDPEASFDGYQSVDLNADDPYAWVDLQVQAIWSAIAFDLDLAYTNPLATPGESSQRLRSPSEIVKTQFGTCIDLALLFAACLEFVEIYPVMFLIDGHSFPGYWRGNGLHDRFIQIEDGTDADLEGKPSALRAQRAPWMLEKPGYAEIVRLVKTDQLVPLETTLLASRGSFGKATEKGGDNLKSEEEFESMIDVKRARTLRVNALPLWRVIA